MKKERICPNECDIILLHVRCLVRSRVMLVDVIV
jgi:hypothetical protein